VTYVPIRGRGEKNIAERRNGYESDKWKNIREEK
jgi:hypothetical protein